MTGAVSDIAFTAAVKAEQHRRGSRAAYARMAEKGDWATTVDDRLAAFIAERDSFYLGTASADGQPYIQHRGGPVGFLKVIDETTLAFADYSGNRQYLSVGNLTENPKAFIFLMDYAGRRRIKIWGRARVVEDDPDLFAALAEPDAEPDAERAIVFEIEAWDRNCPQFITPRRSDAEIADMVAPLEARIAELESDIEALRAAPREGRSGSFRRAFDASPHRRFREGST